MFIIPQEKTEVGGIVCTPIVLIAGSCIMPLLRITPTNFHFKESYRFLCGQQTMMTRSSPGDFVGCLPVHIANYEFPQLMGEELKKVVQWLRCIIQGSGRARCFSKWTVYRWVVAQTLTIDSCIAIINICHFGGQISGGQCVR